MPKARQRYTVLFVILACILTGSTFALWPFIRVIQQEREKMTNLPEPPSGYQWVTVPELSDEFDGEYLDPDKWLNAHPYWGGRNPSQFDPQNVWVKDGTLHLQSTTDIMALSEVTNPAQDVWVRSACVSSKEPTAFYGYYETRMKASQLSMTSSFWCQGKYSEIDVVEQLGAPKDQPSRSTSMLMNTHYYPDGWESDKKTPVTSRMDTGAADSFHIYGVWWKDESTIWFYHNGEKVADITTGGAFLEPMFMFFDTEVFVWEGLPDIDALKDPGKNRMTVDWVRSWELVEK
ncbi:MAG: glycosyl hydrolase family protein [Anaerolineales bacterium]|nr:MAG: glycosyl hydrolase family protein [Anaerolineales bacterium]